MGFKRPRFARRLHGNSGLAPPNPAGGESETVEFKKSTAQLPRGGETLCGFLNGLGGQVLLGVAPAGEIAGQYEALLLERAHARRRWENQPAVGVALEDLDREEILLTRDAAVRSMRISAGTSMDPGDILDNRVEIRSTGERWW